MTNINLSDIAAGTDAGRSYVVFGKSGGADLQYWADRLDHGLSRAEAFVIAVGVIDGTAYVGDGMVLG